MLSAKELLDLDKQEEIKNQLKSMHSIQVADSNLFERRKTKARDSQRELNKMGEQVETRGFIGDTDEYN